MIYYTMKRGYHEIAYIINFGKFAYTVDVTSGGVNDNRNWDITFKTLKEALNYMLDNGFKIVE